MMSCNLDCIVIIHVCAHMNTMLGSVHVVYSKDSPLNIHYIYTYIYEDQVQLVEWFLCRVMIYVSSAMNTTTLPLVYYTAVKVSFDGAQVQSFFTRV